MKALLALPGQLRQVRRASRACAVLAAVAGAVSLGSTGELACALWAVLAAGFALVSRNLTRAVEYADALHATMSPIHEATPRPNGRGSQYLRARRHVA